MSPLQKVPKLFFSDFLPLIPEGKSLKNSHPLGPGQKLIVDNRLFGVRSLFCFFNPMSFNKNFVPVFGFLLLLILWGTGAASYADGIDTSLARKYLNKGVYCFNNSRFDSSLFYYRFATDRYRKEKNWLFYAYCLIGTGKVYLSQYNIEKSNELFDLAEKTANTQVYNNPKVTDADKVYLKYSLAYTLGQYDKVIQYAEQYLQFKSSKYDISYIYYTLGYCYYYLQDYENSSKAYFNAIKTLKNDDNNMALLSKIYGAIAANYYYQSEYNNAISYYNKAINIFENNFKNHPELIRTYTALSIVYNAQEDYKKSRYYLQLALKNRNEKSIMPYIYRCLGRCYEKTDDFAQAEKNYQKALESAKADVNYKAEKITIMLFYGDLCKRQNNREKTLSLYNQALSLSIKDMGIKNFLTSKCYTALGDFYIAEKDYKKAFQNYQSALVSLNPWFNSADIYINPTFGKIFSYSQYFMILKNKADALREYYKTTRRQKDLDMSLETFELLCHEIDRQRAGFMAKEDKTFITGRHYGIYSAAIQTAAELYNITRDDSYKERALKLAEQNKSALLLDRFNENDAKNFGGAPAAIREKERTGRRSIANCEKMIYEESKKKITNPNTAAYWESRLFDARIAADTLAAFIGKNYPGYHRLKYNPAGISSGEIQKALSPESAFIEYTLADTVLYIFVITKEKFEIITQKSAPDREIEKFEQCFNISQIGQNDSTSFNNYTQAAFRLYEKLLKPAEAYIESKNDLIIIPDEKLALIPFEALLYSEKFTFKSYKTLPYLIRKYTIGYAQLATLFLKPQPYKPDKPLLLAVAPEYNSSGFYRQPEVIRLRSGGYNLAPIPGVIDEVKFIEKITGAKIFSSVNATEGAFKKTQRRFNILHLAMHAVVDNKNPLYSKLIFSESKEAGEDGFLNMYELMNMDIGANLTVLSACNTGSGKFLKGEGIMSLARGFFYAGCQSVIMTLWAVDDNSSGELIKNFYRHFTSGKSKTESLRLAKLDFLEHSEDTKNHPYFWAGYVNIGDTSPLYPARNRNYLFVITGIFLLIASGIIFIKIRRRIRMPQAERLL
ncbi:MAG: CHAT domain-containing protein [Bacteroidia bacterium]|nr:CHAT domain-containing protein [Bacteroidia bacterium]